VRKTIVVILILITSLSAHAGINKIVKHTETITLDLSIKDPNVLSVKNDRVSEYLVAKNAIVGSVDSKSGVFNLKPTAAYYERPFSLVIFTELGFRYTIIINPKRIPTQDIVLVNNDVSIVKTNQTNSVFAKASGLIKAMINDADLDGFISQDHKDNADKKEYPIGDNSSYQIVKKYHGETMSGEVLILANNISSAISIKEEDFYMSNVVAVSLSDFNIQPNQEGKIYRVVKNG
jgi:type-F conjugative transfer system secretin TraK